VNVSTDIAGNAATGSALSRYEPVIALEVHAELATKTKMFCGCPAAFGAEANTQVCPICLGHPGVLPVLNRRAVEFGVRAALALNSEVHLESVFARKNYFYPDLPKGYQISQYERPLATGGHLDIKVNGETRRVRIRRVHLEEDTGKSFHAGEGGAAGDGGDYSLVDCNRAGVPLIEIVSEPDCRTPDEARAYLEELRSVLEYAGVSDVRMEEGSMRCEPNVSLRPAGTEPLGVPVELKNLNSFRAVHRALQYEIRRQAEVLSGGGEIRKETRRWDEAAGETRLMRVKETADDYRYFPEPDLPPLVLDSEWIESIRKSLPELRADRAERFVRDYGIPGYDAGILTASRAMADYFEEAVKAAAGAAKGPAAAAGEEAAAGAAPEGSAAAARASVAKTVSNWLMGDVSRLMNEAGLEPAAMRAKDFNFPASSLAELIALVDGGTISGKMAKDVLEEAFKTGETPRAIVDRKGLSQISDSSALEAMVDKVIEANPSVVEEFRGGKKKALGFLVGQIMKETKGKANPQLVNELFRKKLGQS